MIIELSQATIADGNAAAESAKIAKGFVLTAAAMEACIEERSEQVASELKIRTAENNVRVAAEVQRAILTLHVPKSVEHAAESAFEQLEKPIMMRLSPIGAVKNPLKPAIVLDIKDKKAVLDALRMLYGEMYSAENLATEDENRLATVIMQSMPSAESTYRVLQTGEHAIVEGQQGFGSLVGFGEPERFLYQGDEFKRFEPGTKNGIFYQKYFKEMSRIAIGEPEAREVLAFARTLDTKAPLLLIRLKDKSFVCLGCGPSVS